MIAEDTFVESDFQILISDYVPGPTEIEVGPRQRVIVYEGTRPIDFDAKFDNNSTLAFSMNVTGRGEIRSLTCSDELKYTFRTIHTPEYLFIYYTVHRLLFDFSVNVSFKPKVLSSFVLIFSGRNPHSISLLSNASPAISALHSSAQNEELHLHDFPN